MSDTPTQTPTELSVDQVFDLYRTHVMKQLAGLPADAEGNVRFNGQELAISMLASAFVLARDLKVSPDDVETVVKLCMPAASPPPSPIILQ